ncbi:hypothetical protein H671_8g19400 [Cricetulus griseus]|uniref:Uncharacterized protein n=1 Tax=Cricetulus griseus TaxID=10029 RepID=A0A061HVX9_CRIGR|nr:hypothetical protein H671_8g19400 [Cricetulus griseus]
MTLPDCVTGIRMHQAKDKVAISLQLPVPQYTRVNKSTYLSLMPLVSDFTLLSESPKLVFGFLRSLFVLEISPLSDAGSVKIKDLTINPATLNLLEKKVGVTLEQIGTGNSFLNIYSSITDIERKSSKDRALVNLIRDPHLENYPRTLLHLMKRVMMTVKEKEMHLKDHPSREMSTRNLALLDLETIMEALSMIALLDLETIMEALSMIALLDLETIMEALSIIALLALETSKVHPLREAHNRTKALTLETSKAHPHREAHSRTALLDLETSKAHPHREAHSRTALLDLETSKAHPSREVRNRQITCRHFMHDQEVPQ